MATKQFNVELTVEEVRRIKMDAVRLGVTLNEYASEAFKSFRTNRIDDLRGRFHGRHKTVGRKVVA